jgi:hypothetical protein
MTRRVVGLFCLILPLTLAGCESPTDPDEDTVDVDDFVEWSVSPDPVVAGGSTGKTYRVVRGNNQPDEILEYDWKASFAVNITLTDETDDDDTGLEFPVDITSAVVQVQQASGGVVNPPSGGQAEVFESVLTSVTSRRYSGANITNTLFFDVWYDLPSLRREAVITVTVSFKDDEGATFQAQATANVAP